MEKSAQQRAVEATKRDQARAMVREAFAKLYEMVCRSEHAPEAIEFYEWRQLPFHDTLPERVKVFVNAHRSLMYGTLDRAPDESEAEIDIIEIRPVLRGDVIVALGPGAAVIPYWVGWDTYHRIGVICSGPAA